MFKGMLTREIKLWKIENREKTKACQKNYYKKQKKLLSHLVNRVEELEKLNLNK